MMAMLWLLAACLGSMVDQTVAAPESDLVVDLPGLTFEPNFKQYSGYLSGSSSKHLHYWFVESSSNPRTDPVVLWMNGGPGCSSMEGMLNENGPFHLENDGEKISRNPFAWNQVANVVFLEAPAGVGYSYDDNHRYSTDDIETAENNLNAMKDFFQKFPEYKNNDFYISGESYAGIYIPTLVDIMLNESTINLKGFLVGNGLSDDRLNINSGVYFFYHHGLVGQKQLAPVLRECCPSNATLECDFYTASKKSHECKFELSKMFSIVWSGGLNPYNMYAECYGGVKDPYLHYDDTRQAFVTNKNVLPYFGNMFLEKSGNWLKAKIVEKSNVKSALACVNTATMEKYLNLPAVRKALHISDKAARTWELCSDAVSSHYKRNFDTMTPQYQRAMAKKLRILVYNGDVDMVCNFLGDEWFVDALDDTRPRERRMWYYKESDGTRQVAGFYKQYEHISFVTVKGSGHMVPQDRPRQASKMFISFIQNTPL